MRVCYNDLMWCCGRVGFSLRWLARRWRGAGFFFWSSGLRSARARLRRGAVFSFGQAALRSARARGRAGFFFKQVLALVARGRFFLLVKWLCAPRGPEAELFFSLSWFSRRWRGAVFFSCGQAACAPRGPEVGRGVSNPPSLPLDSTLPATS